eukprot:1729567-Pyramimonas_sp.AAC.1
MWRFLPASGMDLSREHGDDLRRVPRVDLLSSLPEGRAVVLEEPARAAPLPEPGGDAPRRDTGGAVLLPGPGRADRGSADLRSEQGRAGPPVGRPHDRDAVAIHAGGNSRGALLDHGPPLWAWPVGAVATWLPLYDVQALLRRPGFLPPE